MQHEIQNLYNYLNPQVHISVSLCHAFYELVALSDIHSIKYMKIFVSIFECMQ